MQGCAHVVIKVYESVLNKIRTPVKVTLSSTRDTLLRMATCTHCRSRLEIWLGMNWTNLWLRARSWAQSSSLLLYLFRSLMYCSCCSATETDSVIHQKGAQVCVDEILFGQNNKANYRAFSLVQIKCWSSPLLSEHLLRAATAWKWELQISPFVTLKSK